MCYCIEKNKVIILLEMSDKCKIIKCPTFQECEGNNPNYRKEVKFTWKRKSSGLVTN